MIYIQTTAIPTTECRDKHPILQNRQHFMYGQRRNDTLRITILLIKIEIIAVRSISNLNFEPESV